MRPAGEGRVPGFRMEKTFLGSNHLGRPDKFRWEKANAVPEKQKPPETIATLCPSGLVIYSDQRGNAGYILEIACNLGALRISCASGYRFKGYRFGAQKETTNRPSALLAHFLA